VISQPRPNGKAMPAAPTLSVIFQFETMIRKSTSRPTKNRKSTSPTSAARESVGIGFLGKIALVKPGIRPNTEGPRSIPPMISAMTRGWQISEGVMEQAAEDDYNACLSRGLV